MTALPILLFVFRRREMRKSAKPAIRLQIGGRVKNRRARAAEKQKGGYIPEGAPLKTGNS
jgi:hypothetical protein